MKKAFDNYSAGGLDRQGPLEEMEKISLRYADQLAAAKAIVTDLNKPLPPTLSCLPAGRHLGRGNFSCTGGTC